MKQKLTTILSSVSLVFLLAIMFISPASAEEVDCAVLPDAICKPADGTNSIMEIINLGIIILTAGVGVVAVGAFIWAGVLYASAGDSAESVTKAKDMMKNTAIGLVLYGIMFLALNWLVPGGIFS